MEIRRGSTSQQILMRAAKALFENQHSMGFVAEKPNRDHYITHDDISNVKRLVDTETWRRHDDDGTSVEMWIRATPSCVLLYDPPSDRPFSPFRLVLQREMQLQWLIKYGNDACLFIDGTFGINKYKVCILLVSFGVQHLSIHMICTVFSILVNQYIYDKYIPSCLQYPLYIILVLDEHGCGHPAAYAFLEREETQDIVAFLRAIKRIAQEHCPDWMPSCFMTDCADNERAAIAEVFPEVPIYLCIYHVRKAWTKKLLEIVETHETRVQMNAALEDLCWGSTLTFDGDVDIGRSAMIKLRIFYHRFHMEEAFIEYFQQEWEPCMGMTYPSYMY